MVQPKSTTTFIGVESIKDVHGRVHMPNILGTKIIATLFIGEKKEGRKRLSVKSGSAEGSKARKLKGAKDPRIGCWKDFRDFSNGRHNRGCTQAIRGNLSN